MLFDADECIQAELDLGRFLGRKLVGGFEAGAITTNGGVALLAGAERRLRLAERLAACFTDLRPPHAITHTLPALLRQRIFGLALDHDALRFDPALAAVLHKPGGTLAGKSTLNRLVHASKIGQDRHHKLDHDGRAIERLLVDLLLEAHREAPRRNRHATIMRLTRPAAPETEDQQQSVSADRQSRHPAATTARAPMRSAHCDAAISIPAGEKGRLEC